MKRTVTVLSMLLLALLLASCSGGKPGSVRLKVNCSPENAEVHILKGDSVLQPGEDGVFVLTPGEYSYSASCEGYASVASWVFTVDSSPEQTLDIRLRSLEDSFGVLFTDPEIEGHDFLSDFEEAVSGETELPG